MRPTRRPAVPRALACAAASLVTLGSAVATAQSPVPSLDLRGFAVPTDPGAGIYLEPAASPKTWEWSAGLYANYVHRPLVLRDPVSGDARFAVIEHQVLGDLVAQVGFGERLALGFDLPAVVWQQGDDPTPVTDALLGPTSLPTAALGDLGLVAKVTVVPPTAADLGGFAMAVHERLTLPTGDAASFVGEGHLTSETRLLFEYRALIVGLHVAIGARFRAEKERFGCASIPAGDRPSADPCPTRFGHELPFGVGLTLKPQAFGVDPDGRATFFLETHGHLPLAPVGPFDDERLAEAQLGGGLRYGLGDLSLLGGVETALLGGIGNAPLRATLGISYVPRSHDADDDGIDDARDECSALPEDPDGFEDADGCPELDNDDDGVPDGADKCPKEKEDEDGVADGDGCPDLDDDRDGVPDREDACPKEPGPADAPKRGCPAKDEDRDGLVAPADRCPEAQEDQDGFQDDDGCPDPDDDGDGVPDVTDLCPREPAPSGAADPDKPGCPDLDADRDTFLGADDRCPAEPETWNGVDDGDGCPEAALAGKKAPAALVVVKGEGARRSLVLARPIRVSARGEVEAGSEATVRAIASLLRGSRRATLVFGVREPPVGDQAPPRAEAIAREVVRYAGRPDAILIRPFDRVREAPGAAANGIGYFLVERGGDGELPE